MMLHLAGFNCIIRKPILSISIKPPGLAKDTLNFGKHARHRDFEELAGLDHFVAKFGTGHGVGEVKNTAQGLLSRLGNKFGIHACATRNKAVGKWLFDTFDGSGNIAVFYTFNSHIYASASEDFA
jgi:hypothetical protein